MKRKQSSIWSPTYSITQSNTSKIVLGDAPCARPTPASSSSRLALAGTFHLLRGPEAQPSGSPRRPVLLPRPAAAAAAAPRRAGSLGAAGQRPAGDYVPPEPDGTAGGAGWGGLGGVGGNAAYPVYDAAVDAAAAFAEACRWGKTNISPFSDFFFPTFFVFPTFWV
jgi:hypothetical protein